MCNEQSGEESTDTLTAEAGGQGGSCVEMPAELQELSIIAGK